MVMYQELGLELVMAPNGRESGIYAVWERLSEGKLKIFSSLRAWFQEFRFYRRDEKGAIVKKDDHLMDATRYLVSGGVSWMETERKPSNPGTQELIVEHNNSLSWLA